MRALISSASIDELPSILPLWRESLDYHARLVPFFRPAPAGDVAWQQYVGVSLAKGDGALFAAWSGGTPVGFIFGRVQTVTPVLTPRLIGYIADLYVREDCRRHGLGRLLFLALRGRLVSMGADALDIHVYLANQEALEFWRSLGFTPYAQKMCLDIPAGGGESRNFAHPGL